MVKYFHEELKSETVFEESINSNIYININNTQIKIRFVLERETHK